MTQEDEVLKVLESGKTLTPLEALNDPNIRSLRLGAVIFDLKKAGHNIVNEWETNGKKRYARYRLLPKERLF